MKKKLKKLMGVIILVAAAFLYAHIAKVHNIYNTEIDPSEYGNTGILTDLGVKQEFVCAEEHLDGIRIKSTVTESAEQILLSYSLKNLSTGEVAASGEAEGKEVKNSKFFEIPFERIENCKDKRFELTVVSNVPMGTAMGIGFAYEKNREEYTSLEVAGEEVEDGTLILKTVTNRFDFETFCVFLVFALYVILFMRFLYRLFK
nr:hypothetical protein [uncultured Blautia sp.]